MKTPDELKAYNRQWFKTPKGRYHQQKAGAWKRGIEFLLTFEEWWDVWQKSGKWEQRGKYAGQYVMARFGDKGAYEVENVRICTVGENTVENTQRLPVRGFCIDGYQAQKWATATPKQRAIWRRQHGQAMRGKSHDRQMIEKMSQAALGRRMVVRDGKRTWAHPGDEDYPD